MSRAFIKEDAGDPDEQPERHQSAAPNYVTPQGLAALREQAEGLRQRLEGLAADSREAKEVKRDLRYFEGRLASAIPVDPKAAPPGEVRFGARVELQAADGRTRVVAIVGQDEAEGASGKIAWDSALALALMGAKKGDRIETEESGPLSVAAISYASAQEP
ncbi:MAG: GreA/GreB family elongation factor [Elusimicrobia bacterium]|nr:GreA/GreB family elongation factor [Elusimicrobiota bacterium]